MNAMGNLVGKRYFINDRKECELRELEKDLEGILGCFVKCSYDCLWSHKHKEEKQEDTDYIINCELYETSEDKEIETNGGFDGEVHEIFYLKGNGRYIVITEVW